MPYRKQSFKERPKGSILRRIGFAATEKHFSKYLLEDAVLSFLLLKRNGIMAFDDYKWKERASPDGTPKLAINAFLRIYKRKITVLMKDYQVWIRKDEE